MGSQVNRTAGHGVPSVPFAQVAGHVQREWQPRRRNPHHALYGLSGAGKSHLIRYGILPAAGPLAAVVVIDLKAGGDEVWDDWGTDVASISDIPSPIGLGPGQPRRAFWRIVSDHGLTRGDVLPAIERLALEGRVILVMDDASSIIEAQGQRAGMGLGGLVDKMLREGRSNGLSVILGLNSTAWAGAGAKALCGTLWVGYSPNSDMRSQFAAVAGLPPDVRAALDPPAMVGRRWLYSTADDAEGLQVLALTTAPAATAA
jgi:hypothetical protein